ncbi:hypothetical protein BH20ACI1_BH20ACI1_19910 [soil metagenome]
MLKQEFQTGVIRPVECFKEGWELIKSDYWVLFAISLVGALIAGFSMYILLGAMLCGIYYCFLQKIDTGTVSFDGLWKGFSYFLPGLIVALLIIVPTLFIYGIIYVPIIMAAVMGSKLSPDEFMTLFFGAVAVEIVFAFIMVCLHTLLLFAFPLIVDRNLSALEAIKLSAKAVWNNLSGVAGLIGVSILLLIPGILTCGLGIYFLTPIMLAGFMVAYRKIFPSLDNKIYNQPPPPNAFSGAGSYT